MRLLLLCGTCAMRFRIAQRAQNFRSTGNRFQVHLRLRCTWKLSTTFCATVQSSTWFRSSCHIPPHFIKCGSSGHLDQRVRRFCYPGIIYFAIMSDMQFSIDTLPPPLKRCDALTRPRWLSLFFFRHTLHQRTFSSNMGIRYQGK